jgi:hypothetical protein
MTATAIDRDDPPDSSRLARWLRLLKLLLTVLTLAVSLWKALAGVA